MTDPNVEPEKAFSFTDKRRIDPVTGTRRTEVPDPAGDAAAPGTPAPGTPSSADVPACANGESVTDSPEAAQPQEVAGPQALIAELTEDVQRISAEYANYRKRVDRDREAVITAAKAQVMLELLPILDDIDRAAEHGDLTGAFKAVTDKLTATVQQLGLTKAGAVGDLFDPQVHEAVQFATSAEVREPTVTGLLRQGYTFADRLVRPAVVVVTGPDADTADNAESTN